MGKAVDISALCRNCTRVKECLRESRLKAMLMQHTTYCTRFDNVDKSPRLFPFLQPYEREMIDAEHNFRMRKTYGSSKTKHSQV